MKLFALLLLTGVFGTALSLPASHERRELLLKEESSELKHLLSLVTDIRQKLEGRIASDDPEPNDLEVARQTVQRSQPWAGLQSRHFNGPTPAPTRRTGPTRVTPSVGNGAGRQPTTPRRRPTTVAPTPRLERRTVKSPITQLANKRNLKLMNDTALLTLMSRVLLQNGTALAQLLNRNLPANITAPIYQPKYFQRRSRRSLVAGERMWDESGEWDGHRQVGCTWKRDIPMWIMAGAMSLIAVVYAATNCRCGKILSPDRSKAI